MRHPTPGGFEEIVFRESTFIAKKDEQGRWWFILLRLWRALNLTSARHYLKKIPEEEQAKEGSLTLVSDRGIRSLIEQLGLHEYTHKLKEFIDWFDTHYNEGQNTQALPTDTITALDAPAWSLYEDPVLGGGNYDDMFPGPDPMDSYARLDKDAEPHLFSWRDREFHVLVTSKGIWFNVLELVESILGYYNAQHVLKHRVSRDYLAIQFWKKPDNSAHVTMYVNEDGVFSLLERCPEPMKNDFSLYLSHEVLPEMRGLREYVTAKGHNKLIVTAINSPGHIGVQRAFDCAIEVYRLGLVRGMSRGCAIDMALQTLKDLPINVAPLRVLFENMFTQELEN